MSVIQIFTQDVLAVAPELAQGKRALSAQAWQEILLLVNSEYDLTQTGEDAATDRIAKIFLAAHMGTLMRRGNQASAGPMTSESMGDVRRSYGLIAGEPGAASLSTTRYGQLYLEILTASVANGPFVV